ncbi:MAG TPA: tyrosine-type recombinase/integrase [Chthoniobacterales bacterium]|nr:tyrosine-type recombinase/integrase [Chthoniobacterales bacterium]
MEIEGRPTGVRERFYYRTEKEAKKAANEKNDQIAAFGTQILLADPERVMAAECIKLLAPYSKTLYDAVHFYRDHLDRQATSIVTEELCDRITAEFDRRLEAAEISPRHYTSMKETVKKFRGRFGPVPIKLLDGSEIKAWIASLPLKVKTRNRHLGYVRNILGIAQERNLLHADPLVKISPFNDPHRKARKVEILTPDELTTFLSKVDKDFIPYFVLNAFTGLRGDEIKKLDWSEVKLDRSIIDLPFTKSKNRKRKLIEVPDNLKDWLQPYVKESDSVMPRKKLQLAFEKAAKDSNLHPWRQNCLRHSFCSYAVASKGFEWTAAQADHTLRILRERYWEVVSKEDAEKYWAIRPKSS